MYSSWMGETKRLSASAFSGKTSTAVTMLPMAPLSLVCSSMMMYMIVSSSFDWSLYGQVTRKQMGSFDSVVAARMAMSP